MSTLANTFSQALGAFEEVQQDQISHNNHGKSMETLMQSYPSSETNLISMNESALTRITPSSRTLISQGPGETFFQTSGASNLLQQIVIRNPVETEQNEQYLISKRKYFQCGGPGLTLKQACSSNNQLQTSMLSSFPRISPQEPSLTANSRNDDQPQDNLSSEGKERHPKTKGIFKVPRKLIHEHLKVKRCFNSLTKRALTVFSAPRQQESIQCDQKEILLRMFEKQTFKQSQTIIISGDSSSASHNPDTQTTSNATHSVEIGTPSEFNSQDRSSSCQDGSISPSSVLRPFSLSHDYSSDREE